MRNTVVIEERKEKINKIKEKYNNLSMSDKNAEKIERLEITNKALNTAFGIVGLITVIDLFIPDPVLGLDELALASITGLLKLGSNIVENKIDKLASEDDASLNMNEVNTLVNGLKSTINSIQQSRSANRVI